MFRGTSLVFPCNLRIVNHPFFTFVEEHAPHPVDEIGTFDFSFQNLPAHLVGLRQFDMQEAFELRDNVDERHGRSGTV